VRSNTLRRSTLLRKTSRPPLPPRPISPVARTPPRVRDGHDDDGVSIQAEEDDIWEARQDLPTVRPIVAPDSTYERRVRDLLERAVHDRVRIPSDSGTRSERTRGRSPGWVGAKRRAQSVL